MVETMYDAPGLGLAAPQVGVQKRLFVWDLNDGAGPQSHRSTPRSSSPTASGPTRRAACRCPASPGRSSARTRSTSSGATSTATRSRSRPPSSRAGCSSTSSTTSTACCCVERLDDDQAKEAKRQVRDLMLGLGPERARAPTRPVAALSPVVPPPAAERRGAAGAAHATPGVSCTSARPRWRCRRSRPCTTPASRSPSWSPAPTSGGAAGPSPAPRPVKVAALELGLPVSHDVADVASAPAPTSAWWWPSGASSAARPRGRCPW